MENRREKYRMVFGSEIGLEVLTDILDACHLGQPLNADNPQFIGEYNAGARILAILGAFESSEVLPKTVSALFSVTPGETDSGEKDTYFNLSED
jgi:hypothetical protein